MKWRQGFLVMETPTQKIKAAIAQLKLAERVPVFLRYGTVAGMTISGLGLILCGGLAFAFNEHAAFFTAFVSGVILIATGGMGFLKCLDQR